MDDSTFRLETKKVDLNIENSLVIEESDIESANYLFRPAATSASEYSNVVSPISDHSNSSSPTNEHQQVEQEIRHIRKHQELLLVHPFHLIDQFAHLRGVLSIDPEGVPDQVLDNSSPEDNCHTLFFRCC